MEHKKHKSTVWILSIAINGLIALSFFLPKLGTFRGYDFSALPVLNAVLNGLTFVSLLVAQSAIRHKNIKLHRAMVFLAFSFTSLFLFSYLLYHFSTPTTRYGGGGLLRAIYFFTLLSHIVLAALIVPLSLLTISFALNREIKRHRKIAGWTMPIWLYVSFTGVVVYLLISPYYHH